VVLTLVGGSERKKEARGDQTENQGKYPGLLVPGVPGRTQ